MSLCGICNDAESKYKCPSCSIPYCSLVCYRPHKAEHLAAPPPAPVINEAPVVDKAPVIDKAPAIDDAPVVQEQMIVGLPATPTEASKRAITALPPGPTIAGLPPKPPPVSDQPIEPIEPATKKQKQADYSDEDPFASIANSPEIQDLLKSHTLRRKLLKIHRSTLEKNFKWGRGKPGRWTLEKGALVGMGRLRQMRNGEGTGNREVEEFTRIVVAMVNKDEGGAKG